MEFTDRIDLYTIREVRMPTADILDAGTEDDFYAAQYGPGWTHDETLGVSDGWETHRLRWTDER